MTQKRKVLLITLMLIFFSGLIISYRSHQLSSDYRLQLEQDKQRDVNYWAAEVLLEKIKILEASVSTLDKSTVSILQRMDVRYFAYAFKVDDQWKIKWKIIGDTAKSEVIKEVNGISFSELSSSQRNWFGEEKQVALVSPVEVAKSEQLTNGFLIFGLKQDFFSGIKKADPQFEIFTFNGKKVKALSDIKGNQWLVNSDLMTRGSTTKVLSLERHGESYKAAAFFASDIQLWLVRLSRENIKPFIASSIFSYFLMAMLFSFSLVVILFSQMINFSESLSAQKMRDVQMSGLSLLALKLKKKIFNFSTMTKKVKPMTEVTDSTSWAEGCDLDKDEEVIADFSHWMDSLLAPYRKQIVKSGITLQVHIPKEMSVRCHIDPTKEFLCRMLENSISSLLLEENKTIEIELMEKQSNLTLSYMDSRTGNLANIKDPAYLLEMDKPLEDINGIVSYGRWLFSNKIHSSETELSIFLELEKVDKILSKEDLDTLEIDRYELADEDDISLENFEFKKITPPVVSAVGEGIQSKGENPPDGFREKSIDDIISSFEMNSLDFKDEDRSIEEALPQSVDPKEKASTLITDEDNKLKKEISEEKKMVQFQAGEFKIKIRSPKKRDDDVHS